VLKESSPSCGSRRIYDGTFRKQKKLGHGVTAALFRRHGIRVVSEEEFLAALEAGRVAELLGEDGEGTK